MFEAGAECTDCHLNDQNAIFRSNAKKCLDCHEEDYAEMFAEWQESVKDLSRSLTSLLKEKRKLKLSGQEKVRYEKSNASFKTLGWMEAGEFTTICIWKRH